MNATALLPGERDRTLLHACLDEPVAAVEAWKRWRALVDFNDIEAAEQRLLPLAYAHLGDTIRDDPVFGRAGGLYRRAWTRNQILFSRSTPALEALGEAGIPTMLLKGAPLSILHFQSPGERPMADVDILVPPSKAELALDVLLGTGWTTPYKARPAITRLQSVDLFDGAAGQVDLHWFSLWSSSSDKDIWEAARPFELARFHTLAPSPTDLLLIVCGHASTRQTEQPVRWVADAATICRTADIDWERLVTEAKRRNLAVSTEFSLRYLRDEFAVEIPDRALSGLAPAAAPRWERREFADGVGPLGPLRTIKVLRWRHRRMKMLGDEAPWHPGFLTFAGGLWGFDKPWQLPVFAVKRVLAAVGDKVRPGRREPDAALDER